MSVLSWLMISPPCSPRLSLAQRPAALLLLSLLLLLLLLEDDGNVVNAACLDFIADCNGCLEDPGCFWCPTEAICAENLPDYPSWVVSSCTTLEDFTQDYCSRPGLPFSDPLYEANEWMYEMINIVPAWDRGYYGAGIHVRINDDGVDVDHDEFDSRIDFSSNCDLFRPTTEITPPTGNNDNDDESLSSHGTLVASIVGGAGNNSVCAVGIAPQVTLSSCDVISDNTLFGDNMDSVDISQNSWSNNPCLHPYRRRKRQRQRTRQLEQPTNENDDSCPFSFTDSYLGFPCDVCDFTQDTLGDNCTEAVNLHCSLHFEEDTEPCIDFLQLSLTRNGTCEFVNTVPDHFRNALEDGITNGRNGKGTIFVFVSGNDYDSGDSLGHRALGNERMAIYVGAVGKDGRHASYSTHGASIFITAPGGDIETITGNTFAAAVGSTSSGCKDSSTGTSFSTPIVSGVIALMLEANPDLSWRDVRSILAETSQSVPQDPDDDSAVTNAAGFWHSDYYGFGIVDALAAVTASEDWALIRPEGMLSVDSNSSLNIPLEDDGTTASSVLLLTENGNNSTFYTESVAVFVGLTHPARGHLEISLISPQGTRSVLTPGKRPEKQLLGVAQFWKLLTVKTWGENPFGDWTLEIVDLKSGDVGACTDHYWHYSFEDGTRATCGQFESAGVCRGGDVVTDNNVVQSILQSTFDGRDAREACCACGGGLASSSVVSRLNEWKIVVSGRYGGDIPPTAAPTMTSRSPTIAAVGSTTAPVQSPPQEPTSLPLPQPEAEETKLPSPVPLPQQEVEETNTLDSDDTSDQSNVRESRWNLGASQLLLGVLVGYLIGLR